MPGGAGCDQLDVRACSTPFRIRWRRYPYSLIFDDSDAPSNRRWALCFTTYQLLRLVCLPLVSQYLRDDIDDQRQG